MRRTRGIRLGRRIVKVFRWVCRSKRSNGYRRLGSTSSTSPSCKRRSQTMMKILNWGRSLKKGALGLCCSARPRALDYCKVAFDPVEVPKGHLVPVYVGQKEDESYRVLVPIIYFNHPLFGDLLKEAEKEFGYNHPGGITIPCPFSEFERVQTCIAAGTPGRKSMRYRDG